MPDLPLLTESDPQLTREHKNAIATTSEFREILDRCFGSLLFPPEDVESFDLASAPLYVQNRDWVSDMRYPWMDEKWVQSPFKHEEYLDRLFWDESQTKRLQFLIGTVGTGKSTLLDFYLRCFCPTISENRHKFGEKLVVQINSKGIFAEDDFNFKFFQRMRDAIQRRCRVRGIDLPVKENPQAPHQWVEDVFGYLSSLPKQSNLAPFRYLVVAIDNLDQAELQVQRRALTILRDWFEPGSPINLWRAYVPLWPQTLDRLMNSLGDPIPESRYISIDVGPLPSDTVRSNRTNAARVDIRSTAIPFVMDPDAEDGKEPIITNTSILSFIADTYENFTETCGTFVARLCYHDIRRELRILENVLSSRVAFKSWQKHKTPASRLMHLPYLLVDAILTAKRDAFYSNKAGVENVYSMTHYSRIGCLHTLHIMGFSGRLLKSTLETTMKAIQYEGFEVHEILQSLLGANVHHEIAGIGGGTEIVVHSASASAYLELAMEPAYIDNCAMVTPVSERFRDKMKTTSSLNPKDFCDRVETSLQFIRQIRADESERVRRIVSSSDAECDESLRVLRRLQIPVLWKTLALRYRERLAGIEERSLQATGDWWSKILHRNSLFDQAKSCLDGLAEVVDRWRRRVKLKKDQGQVEWDEVSE